MITYNKKSGWGFIGEESGKQYSLYEMVSYRGNTTSDIIIIWDHDSDCIVNHVYGANSTSIEELSDIITEYVKEYETKEKEKAKAEIAASYKFTKTGVKAFLEYASDDFFKEMDKEPEEQDLAQFDIVVSCGKHSISVPLGAEEWGNVESLLYDSLENYEC
jgi:hypothetical protein